MLVPGAKFLKGNQYFKGNEIEKKSAAEVSQESEAAPLEGSDLEEDTNFEKLMSK